MVTLSIPEKEGSVKNTPHKSDTLPSLCDDAGRYQPSKTVKVLNK